MTARTIVEIAGWEVVRLRDGNVEVDILPGKGGDILAVRWLPLDLNVLWTSPWSVRPRHSAATATDAAGRFLQGYPGGWQTIFPNGGEPGMLEGEEQEFHGEATQAAYEWHPADHGIEMQARLSRSPFRLVKTVMLRDDAVTVSERVCNEGSSPLEVMWSHHPAFGSPFLSGACRLEAAARTFTADSERDVEQGDLAPGVTSAWPLAEGRDGGRIDLGIVPPDGPPVDRFGYLGDFSEGRISLVNPTLGLAATLTWDLDLMPSAWFWLEARSTVGHPWFGDAYVLALEPASSVPGHGIDAVRRSAGNLVRFGAGEERAHSIRLALTRLNYASPGGQG